MLEKLVTCNNVVYYDDENINSNKPTQNQPHILLVYRTRMNGT